MRVRVKIEFSLPKELVARVVRWYHDPPGMPPFKGDPSEAVSAALETIIGDHDRTPGAEPLPDAVRDFERAYIEHALAQERRLDRTAVRLGIAYSTIKKKVKEHGLRGPRGPRVSKRDHRRRRRTGTR